MTNKKQLNESEIEKVSGGGIVVKWYCPICNKDILPRNIVKQNNENGDCEFYCPSCDKYYPIDKWKHKDKIF